MIIIIAGTIALTALCKYAAGKISEGQLAAEFSAANVTPEVSKDLIEVVSIPEIMTLLSQINAA